MADIRCCDRRTDGWTPDSIQMEACQFITSPKVDGTHQNQKPQELRHTRTNLNFRLHIHWPCNKRRERNELDSFHGNKWSISWYRFGLLYSTSFSLSLSPSLSLFLCWRVYIFKTRNGGNESSKHGAMRGALDENKIILIYWGFGNGSPWWSWTDRNGMLSISKQGIFFLKAWGSSSLFAS